MQRVEQWGHRVGREVESTARAHRDKIQIAAKVGWAAKGGLYVTLGVLAVMAAVGEGGAVSGGKGVLQWVSTQPFGQTLLVLAGIGFACYALWRGLQVAVDPEQHKDTKSMVAKRVGWALSGVLHGALAVAAFQMVAGGQSSSQQMWLAKAMSAGMWGVALVGLLGAVAIVAGLYQFKKAVELGFMDDVDTSQMSSREVDVLKGVGRFGLAARGVVFPIIGYFLILAAVNHSPAQGKGVGGALGELAQASWIALAVIALGLAAYGVLQLFFARYRRVRL